MVLKSRFNKVACLRATKFIKKRLKHRYFSLSAKILRTVFLKNVYERLLLSREFIIACPMSFQLSICIQEFEKRSDHENLNRNCFCSFCFSCFVYINEDFFFFE